MKMIQRFPQGVVAVPPSKSMAHRALVCAALAEGASWVSSPGDSQDIRATMGCLEALGARFAAQGGGWRVDGGDVTHGPCVLDCGESGTTLRFLIPIAAALRPGEETRFVGKGKLMERPQGPYQELFGADGLAACAEGGLCLRKGLPQGRLRLPGNISSQFISGLLLAFPLAGAGGEIIVEGALESASYVGMTAETMGAFGVEVQTQGNSYRIDPGQYYRPGCYTVEGDYSQAAFFLAASALGCPVEVTGLSPASLQGDRVMLEILEQCGARIRPGKAGGIVAEGGGLRGVDVDVAQCPDLVPVLAALLCLCRGESRILNAARLRMKESDRLEAIAAELRKLGADISVENDGLRIRGKPRLQGNAVDSWNDHRIAMALAVAAIGCEGPVVLTGEDAVAKSYPGFWDDFERGGRP